MNDMKPPEDYLSFRPKMRHKQQQTGVILKLHGGTHIVLTIDALSSGLRATNYQDL